MKKTLLILFATIFFAFRPDPFLWFFDDDLEAPSAPTSPSAVGTAEAVAISWTDPTALDLDSIRVFGAEHSGTVTWIASVAKGTQTYNWTGLTGQTIYDLQLKAMDKSGNLSDYTSTVSDTALNTLYAFDFDGSTEYLSKTSPISLDLNGTERVLKDSNSTFEDIATDWATNGTHSITVSSTQKYAGSYSGKVIGTLGNESVINGTFTNWTGDNPDNWALLMTEDADDYVTEVSGTCKIKSTDTYTGIATISSVFTAGRTYKVSLNVTSFTTGSYVLYEASDSYTIATITTAGLKEYTYTSQVGGIFRIKRGSAVSEMIIDDVSIKQLSGDTTTNFISLASSNFTTLEAGKKYTIEVWMNADSTGNGFATKPIPTMKIGSKQFWGAATDTIPIYPGLWKKFVYNFQATSAEVNTPIKFYLSQADTGYIDNFSITEAKDLFANMWINSSSSSEMGIIDCLTGTVATGTGYNIIVNPTTGYTRFVSPTYSNAAYLSLQNATDVTTGSMLLLTYKINRTGNDSIFINGVANYGSNINLGKLIAQGWLIGSDGSNLFNGLIGEVQIATFSDISTLNYTPAQIYYRSKSGYYFPTAYTGGVVVGHWTWEGADDATALTDKSGTGNTLTGTNITVSGDRVTVSGY